MFKKTWYEIVFPHKNYSIENSDFQWSFNYFKSFKNSVAFEIHSIFLKNYCELSISQKKFGAITMCYTQWIVIAPKKK